MSINRRLVLGAGASAVAANSSAHAATRSEGGGRAQRTALSTLTRYAEAHVRDWGLPGITICVVDREGFTGFITSGFANLETRERVAGEHLFQIGSISKVFTALTLHSMAQENKLAPSARVRETLPNIAIANGNAVTMQHLLDHTSGLPGNAPAVLDGGLWSAYTPGAHWYYSNTGYELVSRAIAQADGRLFHESVEARVLRPLGMTQAKGSIQSGDRSLYAQGYEPFFSDRPSFRPGPRAPASWVSVESGAGCIAATAGDMAIFLRYMLALAQGHGGPVLSDASAAAFIAHAADAPGWSDGATYGNGLAHLTIDGRRYLHHTGGMVSFSSAMHIDPEAGVAAFASTNVGYRLSYRPRDITLYACRLLRMAREGGDTPTPAPTSTTIEAPAKFIGAYTAASGDSFEIVADGANQIAMRRNGQRSRLQSLAGPFFVSGDPAFATTGLLFEAEGETIVRAWSNETEFVRGPAPHTFQAPPPADVARLAGIYESDDRWNGPVWIIARAGKLWLNNAEPLTLLGDGSWRPGTDDWNPERIRFDGFVGGRPTRLLISGVPYVRRFN